MTKIAPHVVPQYDANGVDSGLWIMYGNDTVYANLDLRMRGNLLIVHQWDWDNESYNEYGDIDGESYNDIGTLECDNPFDDEAAVTQLYEWLKKSSAVEDL